MPKTYYIYHLPGKKVGCTSNPGQRFQYYRQRGYAGPIIILQKVFGTIREAGDIEWKWADHFGYRRGWHYSLTWAKKSVKTRIASGQYKVNPNKIRFR